MNDLNDNRSNIIEKNIGVAVDVGTTTICVSVIDLGKQSVISEFSFSNPQKIYGTDVITRIKSCLDISSAMKSMSDMFLIKLNEQLKDKLSDDYYKIKCLCYSGNTTMLHILRKLSVDGLASSPFTPVTIDYFECNVSHDYADDNNADDIKEYFLPGFSAFVGADILSGAEFLDMGKHNSFDLLIDLGTNGEMLIINDKRGYATSTACGPVFDHGVTGAVYGSESIHAIASCVKRGLIDSTGLICEPFFDKGIEIDKDFIVKQEQVRRFQMAKAAIYAGVLCLMKKAGIDYDDIENVYISGGLGFYLDEKDAFATKMLPEQLKGKINVSGNTSLAGAKKFLVAKEDNAILSNYESIRSRTEYFELADYEDFEDIYIASMNF